jgi:hypothetical protein
MTEAEFQVLNDSFARVIATYVEEVRKTANLLARAAAQPLSIPRRFAILKQQISENDAHHNYLDVKRRLYHTVLSGYSDILFINPT